MKRRIQIHRVRNLRTFYFICVCLITALTILGGTPARAEGESIHQLDLDATYELIFQTQVGRAICRQILGGDVEALQFHLGVSPRVAQKISRECSTGRASTHNWIYATSPSDIRKLSLKNAQPRKYKILVSNTNFPIESWTEPFTNTTVLVTNVLPLSRERWVQILAHELAVYFDAKASPAHPDAEHIPELRGLQLVAAPHRLNPLIAMTNPLQGHALTFVRALQVEHAVVSELIRSQKIKPIPFLDSSQEGFLRESCAHECLKDLVLRVRSTLLPIGLPLLAFAPHYRSLILAELPHLSLDWGHETWGRAQLVLNRLPVDFLKTQFSGDPVTDMKKVFFADIERYKKARDIELFLKNDLWALEERVLFGTQLTGKSMSLLEYMKRPLLSGYNVGLSSGPRVRIRTGLVE